MFRVKSTNSIDVQDFEFIDIVRVSNYLYMVPDSFYFIL